MALYAFDGTWNKPDTDSDELDENTNVYNFLRFYSPADAEVRSNLDGYKTGVGTRHGAPGRIVGGFFGAGGRDRVDEMVDSFALNWTRNGPEDRTVDVIGFSRGAALALHFCNTLAKGVKVGSEKIMPEIRFLGLWDIVPSFGLPGILLRDAHDLNLFWDLDVPGTVKNCFHAMALDERRGAFDVLRVDPENDDAPRIQEWWFRGVHSDVGGGNGNVQRGNLTLHWMLEQAHACGVPVDRDQYSKLAFLLDAPISHGKEQGRSQDRLVLKNDRIHPSVGRKLQIGEEVTVEVDSRLWFDFSGLLVEEGAQYLLQPHVADRWKDKDIECGPGGWPDNINRGQTVFGWLKNKVLNSHAVGLTRRVSAANWFELTASIGANDKLAFPVGAGQFAGTPWRAPASAPLFFFANDARLSGFGSDFYENNQGTVHITIKRTA